MKLQRDNIYKAICWAICGIASWYASVCIFTIWSYRFASDIASTAQWIESRMGVQVLLFICMHLPDIILSIAITSILTRYFDFPKFGPVIFMLCATVVPLVVTVDMLLTSINYYGTPPSWVVSTFAENVIFIFVLLPAAVLFGLFIGKRWQPKLAC